MPRTHWPTGPRTVFFDDSGSGPTRAKATREGRIRRIATGVWTADLGSPEEEVIRANVLAIIARRIGPSVLVDRTAAMNGKPDREMITIATDGRTSNLNLPGITIRVRPLVRHSSDIPFGSDEISIATAPRSLVDNLAGPKNAERYLTTGELQDWLARKRLDYGDGVRWTRLQEDAHTVAQDLGLDIHDRIDEVFATANQEPGAREPVGAFAIAASTGDLYDERRLELFSGMREELKRLDPPLLEEPDPDGELPFYEAYFSNYIEGTEFEVDEARAIVERNEMPTERPADAHDVLYTYQCVKDRVGRAAVSSDAAILRDILSERHRTFMAGRPEKTPGVFKNKPNFVSGIAFVEPDKVEGTLIRAMKPIVDLPSGLARAVYVMVVVAEIHPFLDGNGRSARLMMNAELSSEGLCRIVIPTVSRASYMSSLRKFTTSGKVDAVVKVLEECWRWTHTVPWSQAETADAYLSATNAFEDPVDADGNSVRLLIN